MHERFLFIFLLFPLKANILLMEIYLFLTFPSLTAAWFLSPNIFPSDVQMHAFVHPDPPGLRPALGSQVHRLILIKLLCVIRRDIRKSWYHRALRDQKKHFG